MAVIIIPVKKALSSGGTEGSAALNKICEKRAAWKVAFPNSSFALRFLYRLIESPMVVFLLAESVYLSIMIRLSPVLSEYGVFKLFVLAISR